MKTTIRKLVCLLTVICLVLPVIAGAAGGAIFKPSDNYDEHDANALREFLNQESRYGGLNGQQLNPYYNPDDPSTWGGVSWNQDGRIVDITWIGRLVTGSIDLSDCTEIRSLNFYMCGMTSINVSGCSRLITLNCEGNGLNYLNVDGCSDLSGLICNNNELTALDLEDCTNLKSLNCMNNDLTGLDLTNCVELANLYTWNNPLKSVMLNSSNMEMSPVSVTALENGSVPLDTIRIGDKNFLRAVALADNSYAFEGWYNGDGDLVSESIQYIMKEPGQYELEARFEYTGVDRPDLASLRAFLETEDANGVKNGDKVAWDGITYDPDDPETWCGVRWSDVPRTEESHITSLEWSGRGLVGSLNLSGLPLLSDAYLSGNNLSSLNLSDSVTLKTLQAASSGLLSIDVTGCSELEELNVDRNLLTELSIEGCLSLKRLDCNTMANLTELNLSDGVSLERVYCQSTALSEIDVSPCVSLLGIYANENPDLTSIDVSNCPNIETISVDSCSIEELDLSGITTLVSLDCDENGMKTLKLDGCTSLRSLSCNENELTELDLSGCGALILLSAGENNLNSLNIDDCVNIESLYINDNNLSGVLDLRSYNALDTLECYYNNLTELYLSGNLIYVYCYGNDLAKLEIEASQNLWRLHCYDNNLIELDVDNFINLEELYCQDNDIERLEIGGCTNLKVLYTSGNPLNYIHTNSEWMGAYPVTVSSQTGGHVELQREQVWIQYLPLTAAAYADEGYEFTGWYDENGELVSTVSPFIMETGSYNIEARFASLNDTYTVTFIDGLTGDTIDVQTIPEGGDAVEPEAPEHEGYEFTGWDGDFTNVTSDLTITALYEEVMNYSVEVGDVSANQGGRVLVPISMDSLASGVFTISYDSEALRYITYTNPDANAFVLINESEPGMLDIAVVNPNGNYDGECISLEFAVSADAIGTYGLDLTVTDGASIADGTTISVDGDDISAVSGSITVSTEYTVTFNYMVDGEWVSETQTVAAGEAATSPETQPQPHGITQYIFLSWDADFSAVYSDIEVTAQYGLLGDVYTDDQLSISDAMMIMRSAAGMEQLSESQIPLADVNGSGALDIVDALYLIRLIIGTESFNR